jgi:hypothetical protein
VLFLIGGCFWVLYRKRWDEMDPQDPGRLLVLDISNSVAQQARKLAPATVHARAALSRIRNILRHSSQEQENSHTIARSAEDKPDPSRVSHVAP